MIKKWWKSITLKVSVVLAYGSVVLLVMLLNVCYSTFLKAQTPTGTEQETAVVTVHNTGLADKLLNKQISTFYSDDTTSAQDIVKAYKGVEHSKQKAVWEDTLSFANRKTANAMETQQAGQGYSIVKVYQFGADETAEVYKCFRTDTDNLHMNVMDEVSYNNYKLLNWYTLNSTADITSGFDKTMLQNTELVQRAGTETGTIKLQGQEKTLVLLFGFQPAVKQLNVVKMVYQVDGLHIDTARVPFPIDNVLQLDTVVANGMLLGARGTGENTFKLVSTWEDTNLFQEETIKDNTVQLDLGVNTLYLHVLDKSLLSDKGEQPDG